MAQKKKKEPQKKEEEYVWTPPNFNEREFLEKDIRSTKTLLVTVLVSFICGILAFLTTEITWILGMLVIIAGILSLRYVYPLFKLDLKEIEKKAWAGNIAMFFFLALGIWILLMNVPFSDHTPPEISDIEVYAQDANGDWKLMTSANSGSLIVSGDNVNISAKVVDNGNLSDVTINVHPLNQESNGTEMTYVGDGIYNYVTNYTASGSDTYYYYTIHAVDSAGNEMTSSEGRFLVNI